MSKTDDYGHKAAHTHDHVTLHNAHPHVAPTNAAIHKHDPDVQPKHKHWIGGHKSADGFAQAANTIVGPVPVGHQAHIVHPRRDKGAEHHVPAGLVNQTPALDV